MRIVVPVDETDRYKDVLDWVCHLGIASPDIKFIHVVPPTPGYDSSFMAISAINAAGVVENERDAAGLRLQDACDEAERRGFSATCEVGFGYPAAEISAAATSFNAELIAIGATPKKSLERVLSGSVTLSVAATARHNLLIVRTPPTSKGKASLVFATDHSDYGSRCLDRLLSWKLANIGQVIVMTAFELIGREHAVAGEVPVVSEREVRSMVCDRMQTKTQSVASQFRQAGIQATSRIYQLPVREAISQSVQSSGAELVVLGTAGHSFWEKVTVGGTALHEIASGTHSLLILTASSTECLSSAERTEATHALV